MSFKPSLGQVFGFKTFPLTDFAPADTNRFGTFKIIGVEDEDYVVGTLDFIGSGMPSLEDVRECGLLTEHRFSYSGAPAVYGMPFGDDEYEELQQVTILGELPITPEEKALADITFSYDVGAQWSTLYSVNLAAEGEWRWVHDRAAVEAEQEQDDAE